MSTHVKSYYASIDDLMLLERLQRDLAGRRISLASISGDQQSETATTGITKNVSSWER
jgi:hypothetical protein